MLSNFSRNLEEVVLMLSTRETPPNPESSRFSRQFLMGIVVASLDMVFSSISGNSLSMNRVLELVFNRGVGLLLLVVGDIVLEMLIAVDNNDILVHVLSVPVDILWECYLPLTIMTNCCFAWTDCCLALTDCCLPYTDC